MKQTQTSPLFTFTYPVIPAQAGIQWVYIKGIIFLLDSRLRGNDVP
jgi:hypothetical protein